MAILLSSIYKMHNNFYSNKKDKERKIRVEIGIPDEEVNINTGLLILLPGYGASIESHVYQRMRMEFCKRYNLITMQCDYFGNRYMSSDIPEEVETIFNMENIIKGQFEYKMLSLETEDEFNDMGIMQALDIVSSTLQCIQELTEKGYCFNKKKIILFGVSHGAYLAHLANVICPELYTCIIDVSSYVRPYYLKRMRKLVYNNGKIQVGLKISQFLNREPKYRYNDLLYDLRFLYRGWKNKCKIIALQGTKDFMVDAEEKREFISAIENAELMLIGPEDVDGVLIKNAEHGLGIDFFVLIETLIPMLEKIFREQSVEINIKRKVSLGDLNASISISYENYLPILEYISF